MPRTLIYESCSKSIIQLSTVVIHFSVLMRKVSVVKVKRLGSEEWVDVLIRS